jgi:hypothetical protein
MKILNSPLTPTLSPRKRVEREIRNFFSNHGAQNASYMVLKIFRNRSLGTRNKAPRPLYLGLSDLPRPYFRRICLDKEKHSR